MKDMKGEVGRLRNRFEWSRLPIMTKDVVLNFMDLETKSEALAIVRYDESCVVRALSHKDDGDIQVVMSKDDAVKLMKLLSEAVK